MVTSHCVSLLGGLVGQVPLLPAGVISTEMLGIWWLNVRVVYAWIMLALGFDIGMQALYIKAASTTIFQPWLSWGQ